MKKFCLELSGAFIGYLRVDDDVVNHPDDIAGTVASITEGEPGVLG